ncbi:MAG: HEPN domain-containing protein [Nitrososphaeria archaeon]
MANAEELRDLIAKLVEELRERLEKDPDLVVEAAFPVLVPRVEVNEMSYSPEVPGISFKYKYSLTQVQPTIRRIDRTKLTPPLDEYYDRAVGIIVDRILSASAHRYWYKEEKVRGDVSSTLDGLLLEAARGRGPEPLPDLLARWYDESEHPSWNIRCYLSGLRMDVEDGIELEDGELTIVLRRPTLTDLKELLDWKYPFEVPLPVFEPLYIVKTEKEKPSGGDGYNESVEVGAFSIISAVLELRGSGDYEVYNSRELAKSTTWRLMIALALLRNCWSVAKDHYPSYFYGALAIDNVNIFGEGRFWVIPPQSALSTDPEAPAVLPHLVYNQCSVTEEDAGRLRELWYLTKEYEVAVPLSTALDRYLTSIQTANDPKESITHAVMAMEAIYGKGSSELSYRFQLYAARLLKALGEKVECLRQMVGDGEKLRDDLKNAYSVRNKFVHGDIEKIEKEMGKEKKKEKYEDLSERVREYARLSILALLLLGADRGGNFKAAKDNMLNLIEESLLAPERLDELLPEQFLQRMSRFACVGRAPSPTI